MEKQIKFTDEMFLPAVDNFKEAEKISRPSISYWSDAWRRLKSNKLAMFGLIIIVLLLIMAIIGPYLSGFTYFEQDFSKKNLKPNAEHWFGTDTAGRDLFTRAWYGARISLFIGFMAALIDFLVGVVYGGILPSEAGERIMS